VQLANPKAAVLMLALYPQFVPPDRPRFVTTSLVALLQVTIETALYLGLAAGVGRARGSAGRTSAGGSTRSPAPCWWAWACGWPQPAAYRRRHTRRRSVAQRVSSCRLDSCSLRSTDETCVSTVLIDTLSRRAISLYV